MASIGEKGDRSVGSALDPPAATAAQAWASALGEWGIPPSILAAAPAEPWRFPPGLFKSSPGDQTGVAPASRGRALEALGSVGDGGSVLDVGVGGGRA